MRVAFSGFPFERRDVRTRFASLLERTGWRESDAALRLLCMHHCAEGATVGPGDFTFTTASDVIRLRDVPPSFAAVLSGHIHRRQALTTDLRGRPLNGPVLYPGSIERTARAEMGETKGYLIVHVQADGNGGRARWEPRDLYARPMFAHDIAVNKMSGSDLDDAVRAIVRAAPPDAVLRIRVTGELKDDHLHALRARHVRTYVPESMNVEIQAGDGRFRRSLLRRRAEAQPREAPARSAPASGSQLGLGIGV